MIGCVLIGLWTFFSSWEYQYQWYVMECKFFGVCVVSKGAEKTCFTLKMIQMMRTFHIPINLDLNGRGSREGHNHNTYQISTKFLVNVILCARPLITSHYLQEISTETLWLVQGIQMLWYDWCEIHTPMRQSDWYEIHTQMWRSDWCEQQTTLQANIELFSLIKHRHAMHARVIFWGWVDYLKHCEWCLHSYKRKEEY